MRRGGSSSTMNIHRGVGCVRGYIDPIDVASRCSPHAISRAGRAPRRRSPSRWYTGQRAADDLLLPPSATVASGDGVLVRGGPPPRFREALADGTADGAFRLLGKFRTQDEPAYCGLSTLVMVLNALEVDPQRQWKGVWRWYAEEMLECCEPLEKVKAGGITFPKWCCLARMPGAERRRGPPVRGGRGRLPREPEARLRRRRPRPRVLVLAHGVWAERATATSAPSRRCTPPRTPLLILDVGALQVPAALGVDFGTLGVR